MRNITYRLTKTQNTTITTTKNQAYPVVIPQMYIQINNKKAKYVKPIKKYKIKHKNCCCSVGSERLCESGGSECGEKGNLFELLIRNDFLLLPLKFYGLQYELQ